MTPTDVCIVSGCISLRYRGGYCSKHYQQMRRCGKILKRSHKDPNEFIIDGEICYIILYDIDNNEIARAMVDINDYNLIKEYKWWFKKEKGFVCTGGSGSKNKRMILHELLINTPDNKQIDHKNRNRLDNRRKNLRICTGSENQCNRGRPKNNTSGYKGVSWSKKSEKWIAYLNLNYRRVHTGYFENKLDAARSHDVAAKKHHGEFAELNEV